MSLSKNTFVAIGDIHGCAQSLNRMLEQCSQTWGTHPTYVFLGDYIDRGTDEKAVIDQLIEFDKSHDCIFIRGNHDQMLLDALHEDKWTLWLQNGGETTLNSYGATPGSFSLPESHQTFFEETRIWWDTEEYLFVHGGINPHKTVSENLNDELEKRQFIWQRSHIDARQTAWEKTVVFGHTPVKEPIVEEYKLGLDTGCVYSKQGLGTLTAASLPEIDFLTVQCSDC